jgi:hypothetical protein
MLHCWDSEERKIINNFVKQYKEKELQWKILFYQH